MEWAKRDGEYESAEIRDQAIEAVLTAICLELCRTSITLETETQPALLVAGSWMGGMLGVESDTTDEVARTMFERGRELRNHLAAQIGLPRHASIDELRERWAEQGIEMDRNEDVVAD